MRIIAGPCQHESYEQSLEIASHLHELSRVLNFEYYFKASFDKANRTSLSGKRGLGFHETLEDFLAIKEAIPGLKTLTDVHEIWQVNSASVDYRNALDVLQIPAFLCRQTDLIKSACDTDFIINVKKGQFFFFFFVAGILTKTENAKEVWITERGTSFGYNTLINDFTGIQYMLDNYTDVDIVFDATHSVQKPGGNGTSSGGNRSYVPTLARAAAAVGVQSFFMETHPSPDDAPSDGPNMVKLEDMVGIIQKLLEIERVVK